MIWRFSLFVKLSWSFQDLKPKSGSLFVREAQTMDVCERDFHEGFLVLWLDCGCPITTEKSNQWIFQIVSFEGTYWISTIWNIHCGYWTSFFQGMIFSIQQFKFPGSSFFSKDPRDLGRSFHGFEEVDFPSSFCLHWTGQIEVSCFFGDGLFFLPPCFRRLYGRLWSGFGGQL